MHLESYSSRERKDGLLQNAFFPLGLIWEIVITVSVNVVGFVTLMGNISSLTQNETADKMPFNY